MSLSIIARRNIDGQQDNYALIYAEAYHASRRKGAYRSEARQEAREAVQDYAQLIEEMYGATRTGQ